MTVLAIDGPAGAGKSTVALAVARELAWDYLDTGALYRAVALAALDRGIDPRDGIELGRLAQTLDVTVAGEHVHLEGRDVTALIREQDVTAVVSTVAAHRTVREALVARQRRLAAAGGVVMEGRDIGTVVAPEAGLKVFLTATLAERARRRARQLRLGEDRDTLIALEKAISLRDATDSAREQSPLAAAEDAFIIDSTNRDFHEVVAEIVARARRMLDVG